SRSRVSTRGTAFLRIYHSDPDGLATSGRPDRFSLRRKPMIFAGRAEQQVSRVKHPIGGRFLPVLPSLRKLLGVEHPPDVVERQCRLAAELLGRGVVGQEGEQKAELAAGADEVVLAQELGELL